MKKEKYNFNPMSLAISIGVVFILIFVVLLPVYYSLFGYMIKEIPACTSPIEHTCYRYVTTGGLLGGVSSFKTSCNNPHDYYMNVSSDWTNCNPINIKGFD